jgi:hypothetical protein
MQVIGFNFTKVLAEKEAGVYKYTLNTNIEFTDIIKENLALLKDTRGLKIMFKYSVDYSNEEKKKDKKMGLLEFDGSIVFAVDKKEEKELLKGWKKKQMPPSFQIPFYNIVLKKCSPKAVYLADELGLPSPVPLPKIQPKPPE